MDLGLSQRQVAETLGANTWTYLLWEHDRTRPTPRFVPRIIEFLGDDPFPKDGTLGDRLRAARRALGLTQERLAQRLEVDESTVQKWERGRHTPPVRYWPRILGLIGQEQPPEDIPLSERIRAYRRAHGLTQTQLGKKLGARQSMVSAWENGRRTPRARYRFRILDILRSR